MKDQSNTTIIKIATEIAENEVERRIGYYLAIEITDDGNEQYTGEAQNLFNEVYDEAFRILEANLDIQ